MKKKILILLSLMLSALMALCVGACGDGDSGKNKGEFSMVSTVDLTLEQLYSLSPKLDGVTVDGVTYAVADPSIVTVDDSGNVVGKACGTTTVTATFESYSATATITVTTGKSVPYMVINNLSNNDVTVSKGELIDFDASVMYGGKEYKDLTLTVTVDDDNVGEAQGSAFTAKKVGECTVTVKANWRGVTSPALSQTVKVNVISQMVVFMNGNLYDEYNLYIKGSHDGKIYEQTLDLDCVAKANGEDIPYNLEIVEGQDVISLSNQKISVLSLGKAVVRLSATDEGVSAHADLTINVKKPLSENVVDYTQHQFDLLNGQMDTTAIFGEQTTIVEAYDGDKALNVEDGNLFGIQEKAVEEVREFIVYDQTGGYRVNVTVPSGLNEPNTVAYFHKSFIDLSTDYIDGHVASAYSLPIFSISNEQSHGDDGASLKMQTILRAEGKDDRKRNRLRLKKFDQGMKDVSEWKYMYFYVYTADTTSVLYGANNKDFKNPMTLAPNEWTLIMFTQNSSGGFDLNGTSNVIPASKKSGVGCATDLSYLHFTFKWESDTTPIYYISPIRVSNDVDFIYNEPNTVAYFHKSFGTDGINGHSATYYGTPTFSISKEKAHGTDGASLKVVADNTRTDGTVIYKNRLRLATPAIKDITAFNYLYFYVYTDVAMTMPDTNNRPIGASDVINFTAGQWTLVSLKKASSGDWYLGNTNVICEDSSAIKTADNISGLFFTFQWEGETAPTFYVSPIRVSTEAPTA